MRRYLPELKKFSEKYIYEPAKAPIADQTKAGCLIKGDGSQEKGERRMKTYPKPMFDLNERRGIFFEGAKKAYDVGLYDDDERVKNGSWKELFPNEAEGLTQGKRRETQSAVKLATNGEVDGEMDDFGEENEVEEGAKGGRGGKGKDMGVDQDEDEAKELGGETKGGDHRSLTKRKRGDTQATLDRVVTRSTKGKT